MWLPCLFAFAFGFTKAAQLAAIVTLVLIALVSLLFLLRRRGEPPLSHDAAQSRRDIVGYALSAVLTLFCVYLLHTHVLQPYADGSLWVGP